MKILWAGDTHGDYGHFPYLMHHARSFGADRIFVLGDFGAWEHTSSGVQFMDKLERLAAANDFTIYWLRGNHDKVSHTRAHYSEHDDEGFLIVRPHIKYAEDGLRFTWDGVKFLVFGGGYSVDKDWRLNTEQENSIKVKRQNRYRKNAGLPLRDDNKAGTLWFPEEEASDNDVDTILLQDSSPVDVLLTHDKPRNSHPSWNRKTIFECLPNQDRVSKLANHTRPYLNLHGHLHFFYVDQVRVGLPGTEPSEMWVVGLDADVGKRDESFLGCDLKDIRERKFLQRGLQQPEN